MRTGTWLFIAPITIGDPNCLNALSPARNRGVHCGPRAEVARGEIRAPLPRAEINERRNRRRVRLERFVDL